MPEFRKDPIIDRWVVIATERSRRPSDFAPPTQPPAPVSSVFSPGNEAKTPAEVFQIGRPESAEPNSSGWRVRVVPNKFPALSTQGDLDSHAVGMFDVLNGVGAHEVVIEHPEAAWDMADATPAEMSDILDAYIARNVELAKDERFRYILTFRNAGTAAGASINHPHSQIIALPVVPKQTRDQLGVARIHYREKRRSIFGDLVRQELESGARIVESNEHFVVLCPYAARFPFEMQIFPMRQQHDFTRMTDAEKTSLSEVLPRTLKRIKVGLGNPSYNMMLQTAPITHARAGLPDYWGTIEHDFCWRIDILPRLTQVAGFEWGTGVYINPVAPEEGAEFLRGVKI